MYTQKATQGTIENDPELTNIFETPNLGDDRKDSKASQIQKSPLLRALPPQADKIQ